jgi:hypothetical protein
MGSADMRSIFPLLGKGNIARILIGVKRLDMW